MKKIILISCSTLLLNSFDLIAQSFEVLSIPNVTTTPSDSRSANFIDVNGDGWDDIYITNSAGPGSGQNNFLYINNTDGTFTTVTSDPIVQDNSRSVGASFADADNDGDLDAYLVTWGSNTINYFYRNNGDGSFTYEPSNVSGSISLFSEMTTWIDGNNDQNLDIYFTNSLGSAANRYYQNQNNGSFTINTSVNFTNEVLGTRSVDYIDYDNDGDCDLFLTNENDAKNSLFRNDGANNFTAITNLSIVQDFKNSAGSSWADIDNDGDFDLFVANYNTAGQANQLFRNDGNNFTEMTSSAIANNSSNSFGSTFGDLDNDGDLDLIVCNSYLGSVQNNYIYINDGSGNFTRNFSSALATFSGWTYSAALGDYNNDGWLDVIFANNQNSSQTNTLFRNTGSGNNWVKFNLTGTTSNTSAIGTKIRMRATINGNDVWQTRHISANSGYCSQNSYTQHFGLSDAASIEEIEVSWPSGLVQNFDDLDELSVNATYDLAEGGSLSIEDHDINSPFKLFPNPVNDIAVLSIQPSQYSENLKLSVYDINGKLQLELNNIQATSEFVDFANLSSGLYIYKLTDGNKKLLFTGKLIKK